MMVRGAFLVAIFAASFQGSSALSLRSSGPDLDACKSTHPARFQDVDHWSTTEVLSCYAAWHTATLKLWRQSPTLEGCSGRHANFLKVDRGFGDASGGIVGTVRKAILGGRMVLLDFNGQNNVWQSAAMEKPPFDWDLRKHLDLFCFEDAQQYQQWANEGRMEATDVLRCPTCLSLHSEGGLSGAVPELNQRDILRFLFRPSAEVQELVDSVLAKVPAGEKLVGVHVRTEWFGQHHACGCKEPSDIGRCASNLGNYSKNFEDSNTKFFVAADNFGGIKAFQKAFGADRVLSLPETFGIQHSLACEDTGAIRIFADFLLLTKADQMLGSCGSTFSNLAHVFSGRSQYFNTDDARGLAECVSGGKQLDYSGFAWEKLSSVSTAACNCYAPEDPREGACQHQCQKSYKPSRCSRSLYESEGTDKELSSSGLQYSPFWHQYLPAAVVP